jgi:hypothetical protein
MRPVNLSRGDEWFKHGMRPLGAAPGRQQPEPRGDAVDMGIDRKSWMSTCKKQDTGDRLRPNTGKLSQEGPRRRHRHLRQKIQM